MVEARRGRPFGLLARWGDWRVGGVRADRVGFLRGGGAIEGGIGD
jgi:hypothetical protein